MKSYKTFLVDQASESLQEAKKIEFWGEDDNYVIGRFDYEGKEYSIMARGKDWDYAWEVYEGEDDDEIHDDSARNYRDLVNKISKWVKKFTKGKFVVKFPNEREFEDEISHGPVYDD